MSLMDTNPKDRENFTSANKIRFMINNWKLIQNYNPKCVMNASLTL